MSAGERGVALLEALVAAGIAGLALVVFLGGLSTGLLSTSASDRLSTAHELARSQMEFTKATAFAAAPATYPTVMPPTGYSITAAADAITGGDASIERITVTITKDGAAVYTLEGYKVNR